MAGAHTIVSMRIPASNGAYSGPAASEPALSGATRPNRRLRARSAVTVTLAVVAGLAATAGLVLGGQALVVMAVNPVGDEWQCGQGYAPADHVSGGSACFAEGSQLPHGYAWHPWGNRPMSYNCDKDGWVEIARGNDYEFDCVREGTDLPKNWEPFTLG